MESVNVEGEAVEVEEVLEEPVEVRCLPIGSVVKIGESDSDSLFMIAGYLPENDAGERRDYIAVHFPIGVLSKETYFFFNHCAIYEVVYEGYRCDKFLLLAGLIESEMSETSNYEALRGGQ